MAALTDYLWIAVIGGIFGFIYGFLIGANDVANAFASSVAAKSITLKQAVIIASFCEFGGAFLLGASVTSTVRSKLFDVDQFQSNPALLMFGMFTSLLSANIMLFIATHLGMPVSTTHDVVGCILGFAVAAKGLKIIHWDVVTKIFISWVTSPLISAAFGAIIFGLVKFVVMRAKNPFQRAYWTFPIILTIFIGIDIFYVFNKGLNNFANLQKAIRLSWLLPMSFGVGALCGVIWIFIVGPIVKRRINTRLENEDAAKAQDEAAKADPEGVPEEAESDEDSRVEQSPEVKEENISREAMPEQAPPKKWTKPWEQDLEAISYKESPRAQEIWDEQENFDPHAEGMFNYIQVFTACLNSFAHGANDVANTIAPMSAIIQIYQTGAVDKEATVQRWLLAFGGFAIVLGLLLYGYRVMKSLGYKLTKLSASRGASAELGASLTVVTASYIGLPISSTQCIVGAITGVGAVGGAKSVQWLFLLKICVSWVALFFCCVFLSAGIFSFAAYSPDIN